MKEITKDLFKTLRVIESCVTYQQYLTAEVYVFLFLKKHNILRGLRHYSEEIELTDEAMDRAFIKLNLSK